MTIFIISSIILLVVSARWNWWRLPAKGVPVLMYHKIGIPPPGSQLQKLWVSREQFRKQLQYLQQCRYTPITFSDVARLRREGRPLPEKPVIITFDDGYQNNYSEAFPLLEEFRFKATFFVVVNAIGRDNFWHDPKTEARLPMMSWQELREMAFAGHEIASHTMNHPRLGLVDPQRAKEELQSSLQALLEKIEGDHGVFAYPYGHGADEPWLQEAVRDAGYSYACSIHQGKADLNKNLFCLKRIFVRGDDTLLDFHLNMTRGKSRF